MCAYNSSPDSVFHNSGATICFAGIASRCHYRGDIYRGPDPVRYMDNDPDPDFWYFEVDETDQEGLPTAVLLVRLSGGSCRSS